MVQLLYMSFLSILPLFQIQYLIPALFFHVTHILSLDEANDLLAVPVFFLPLLIPPHLSELYAFTSFNVYKSSKITGFSHTVTFGFSPCNIPSHS